MYYKRNDNEFVFVNGTTSVSFTSDDKEGYYQKYQEWLAEGNTPEPWRPV